MAASTVSGGEDLATITAGEGLGHPQMRTPNVILVIKIKVYSEKNRRKNLISPFILQKF